MNRRIIFIAVMPVILAGLGIALFVLSRPHVPVREQIIEEYIYFVGTGGANALNSVTVRNSLGEYTLNSGDTPVIYGFENVGMYTHNFFRILNTSARLVSRGLVTDEAANLAVFGLAPPRAEVIIEPVSGEAAALLIGSAAPDGNVYVKLGAATRIYLASFFDIDIFLKSPLDFVNTEITLPAQGSQTGMFLFEKITLGGLARQGEEISIVNVESAESAGGLAASPWRIISPVNAAVSMDNMPLIEALFGLSADRFTAQIAGNEEPGRYGLAQPWSTAEVSGTHADGTFRLRVSKPDEAGMAYIHREGTPLIFEISAFNLPWLEVSWFELMEKLVIFPFIDSIASVDIKTPERTVTFSLSGTGDGLAVKAGAVDIDTRNFRTFYQTLAGARYDEYSDVFAASLPPPFLEIVYRYRDSGKSADTVSFHQAASRRVLTSLNRGRPHFTFSAYTDQVLADLDLILSGQRVRSYL